MILKDGMTLYHGSYVAIEKPDLTLCRRGKDFGKGFYLTTDYEQARRFTKSSINKAIAENRIEPGETKGYISAYTYSNTADIEYIEFIEANEDWLMCVTAHRKETEDTEKWRGKDIIAGKIANDNTNFVITAFMRGAYGEITDRSAIDTAIRMLKPENLKDQICLRTDRAIRCIKFQGFEEVSL